MALQTVLKGECECCDKVDVTVYVTTGNIRMCSDCKEKQDAAVQQAASVNTMIVASRSIDANIQIKTDIFQAATVAAVELKGAIDADEAIPADQKNYIMAQESLKRYQNLQKVIFEERQALLVKENELRMWQTQVQNFAGKLRAEQKEQFRNFDINYQPQTPKSVKPAKAKSVKVTAKAADIIEAAAKYNVPSSAVAMVANARNLTAEGAAKYLAETLGKNKQTN